MQPLKLSCLFDTPKATPTAEIYDPASGKFTPAGNMSTPRGNNSAVLLPNGTVLIVGGAAGAELYDPATNPFLPAPTVSANRCSASATTLANGRVLIAGGTDCSNTILDPAEIYDPATGSSTFGRTLIYPEVYTATLLTDGSLVVVDSKYAEIYKPSH